MMRQERSKIGGLDWVDTASYGSHVVLHHLALHILPHATHHIHQFLRQRPLVDNIEHSLQLLHATRPNNSRVAVFGSRWEW